MNISMKWVPWLNIQRIYCDLRAIKDSLTFIYIYLITLIITRVRRIILTHANKLWRTHESRAVCQLLRGAHHIGLALEFWEIDRETDWEIRHLSRLQNSWRIHVEYEGDCEDHQWQPNPLTKCDAHKNLVIEHHKSWHCLYAHKWQQKYWALIQYKYVVLPVKEISWCRKNSDIDLLLV